LLTLRNWTAIQDADSDIRLARRIKRDCRERGRTVQEVLTQYQETVRPMHDQWVEPCKSQADLIVPTAGSSGDDGLDVVVLGLATRVTRQAGWIE
jgi:uridine kinase